MFALTIITLVRLAPRLGVERAIGTPSWEFRFSTIVAALDLWTGGLREFLFGVGPGQAQLRIIAGHVSRVGAIYSIAGRYIAETGLLGITAICLVAALAVRAVARSSARNVGAACLMAWSIGVVVTTSYLSLVALWAFLGLLLTWDCVFPAAGFEQASPQAGWPTNQARRAVPSLSAGKMGSR